LGRILYFLALLLAGSAFATPSAAQLVVDRMWVDMRPDSAGREDLVLRNESADRYYVSLVASEILGAGTEAEQRVEIADPEALGLLISPTRLILEPGASRAVRIVNIGEVGAADRVYRLRITPQVTDVDAGTDVSEGETGVSIRVLMAYDILVVSRPAEARPQIVSLSEPGAVLLRNEGNTNTLLLNGEVCPRDARSGDQGACRTLDDHRLYVGETWKIETDISDPVLRFKSRTMVRDEDSIVEFSPQSGAGI
jgi:P pilus assembly chaperone PapD